VDCGYHRYLSRTNCCVNTECSYCPYSTSLTVSSLHYNLCPTHSCARALSYTCWYSCLCAQIGGRGGLVFDNLQRIAVAGAKTDKTMPLVVVLAWNLLTATFVGTPSDPILDHLPSWHHYTFSMVSFDAIVPSILRCHKWPFPSSFPIQIRNTVYCCTLL